MEQEISREKVPFTKNMMENLGKMARKFEEQKNGYLQACADGMGLEGNYNVDFKEMAFVKKIADKVAV